VWRQKGATTTDSTGSRKRMSGAAGLTDIAGEELGDTATSPIKPAVDKEGNDMQGVKVPRAQKQLIMSPTSGGSKEGTPPPPPKYVSPRELKKMKRTTPTCTSPAKEHADSLEEGRSSK